MELGQRLKQARLALGLSQRQLCGDTITRNMLSQIENGAARPSMDTLHCLAARLGKPVSYFLEEETVTSPNQSAMAAARAAARTGAWQQVLTALEPYRRKDPVFDEEAGLLRYLALTALAEGALDAGKKPYAMDLLEQAKNLSSIYITAQLRQKAALLTAKATGHPENLPAIDELLLLHARAAMVQGDLPRCAALLDGCAVQSSPEWNLLRGRAYLKAGAYGSAVTHLREAEAQFPAEAAPLLETAYRELGDYKMAYEYACKQR